MHPRGCGIWFAMLSAVLYGFTPVLVRTADQGGANPVTMVFFRSALAIPLLFQLVRRRGVPFALEAGELRKIIILGTAGMTMATALLYGSYRHIPVGIATALHFTYPLLVSIGCFFLFRERIGFIKGAALILGTLGILFFLDAGGTARLTGIAMALLSGVCYAFYVVYLSWSGLENCDPFKLAFYLSVVIAAISGLCGWVTGTLSCSLTPLAWLCTIGVSLCISVAAQTLFQLGSGSSAHPQRQFFPYWNRLQA